MLAFREANHAIMSNARCLTEGVDVPAVDVVAFLSPRKSKVDIVQAIGRASSSRRWRRFGVLDGWSWGVLSDKWEYGFSRLKEFLERGGHCRVPLSYKTADGYKLGVWVSQQRQHRGTTDPQRQQRLETLAGWSWDPQNDKWEYGFSRLKEFSVREGHCRVPDNYETRDGYRLSSWVGMQRRKRDKMDSERQRRLERLPGWLWKVGYQWSKWAAKT
jgi:hypothetical protein